MKKAILITMALVMILALVSCGNSDDKKIEKLESRIVELEQKVKDFEGTLKTNDERWDTQGKWNANVDDALKANNKKWTAQSQWKANVEGTLKANDDKWVIQSEWNADVNDFNEAQLELNEIILNAFE